MKSSPHVQMLAVVTVLIAILAFVPACPQPDDPGPARTGDKQEDLVRFPAVMPTLKDRLARHMHLLSAGNPAELLSSLDRLGRIGEPAIAAIEKAIAERGPENPRFVANALRALDVIASPRAESIVLAHVDSPNGTIKRAALDAIGSCGAGRALAALVPALGHAELGIVARAFRALERLKPAGCGAILLERLDSLDTNIKVPAIRLLGELGEKTALPRLRSIIKGDAPVWVRLEAVKAMHALGDDSGLDLVAEDARDATDAAWAARMGILFDFGRPEARLRVAEALASSEPGPREMAQRMSMVFPAAGSPPTALLTMLGKLEGNALAAGLEQTSLWLKAGSEPVETFVIGILSSPDRDILSRVLAARLLVASERPGTLDLVRDQLLAHPGSDSGPQSLAHGLAASLEGGGDEGLARLRDVLESDHRVAVLGALQALSARRESAEIAAVVSLLEHEDAAIRRAAVSVLAQFGTVAEIAALKAAFARESDTDMRRAIAAVARHILVLGPEDVR
jgi:HEAT repeat protein